MGFNKIRRIKEWKLEQRRFIEGRYKNGGVEPIFYINDKKVDLMSLKDRSVKVDIFSSRGNSAGQNAMIRKMDNKSLIDFIYNALENVGIKSDSDVTYDEGVVNILLPELLDRFEDMDRKQHPSKYVDDPKVELIQHKDGFIIDDVEVNLKTGKGKNYFSTEENNKIDEFNPMILGNFSRGCKIMQDALKGAMNEDICLNIEEPLG